MNIDQKVNGEERAECTAGRRIRPQRVHYPRTKDLAGVVVVVTARDRRAAVARCLEALRDCHEHCADIVYVDEFSADRSSAMVRQRFSFARVVPEFVDALRAVRRDAAPPRFVAVVSPDVTLDGRVLRALVRAAANAPEGEAVAPALEGPEGCALETPVAETIDFSGGEAESSARAPGRVPIWVARRRDIRPGAKLTLRAVSEVRALVPRPAELSSQLEMPLDTPLDTTLGNGER